LLFQLPEGAGLTLSELREMAGRQQRQIDSQRQLLAAKEQRLLFLKQQDARSHAAAAEQERLRRLRARVEAQELKLRKLRALRGQVDQNRVSNTALSEYFFFIYYCRCPRRLMNLCVATPADRVLLLANRVQNLISIGEGGAHPSILPTDRPRAASLEFAGDDTLSRVY
jgi:hypothetical protein